MAATINAGFSPLLLLLLSLGDIILLSLISHEPIERCNATSIIASGRFSNIPDPIERFNRIMRALQGALILASTLQIVLGFRGIWGKVCKFLSPVSNVPLTTFLGPFILLNFPVARDWAAGADFVGVSFVISSPSGEVRRYHLGSFLCAFLGVYSVNLFPLSRRKRGRRRYFQFRVVGKSSSLFFLMGCTHFR